MRNRFLLLIFAILMTSACFTYYAVNDCILNRARCFDLTGNSVGALAPERYRVVQKTIEDIFVHDGEFDQILLVDIILNSVLTAVIIPALFIWLKRWLNDDRAMLGVFVFIVLWIASFHFYFRGLSIAIEVFFTVLMMIAISRRKLNIIVCSILIVLGSLNRETTIMLPLAYAAYYADDWRKKNYRWTVIYFIGLWAVVTAGLHIGLGYAPHVFGNVFTGTLAHNLEYLPDGILTIMLTAPIIIAVIASYRYAPPQLKRIALVAGIYGVAILTGGGWGEVERLVLPPLVLTLPMVFYSSVSLGNTTNLQPQSKP